LWTQLFPIEPAPARRPEVTTKPKGTKVFICLLVVFSVLIVVAFPALLAHGTHSRAYAPATTFKWYRTALNLFAAIAIMSNMASPSSLILASSIDHFFLSLFHTTFPFLRDLASAMRC
jgi:hypothetical protein